MQIEIYGNASQTSYSLDITKEELTLTLMDFLNHHDVHIASSCNGEGVCKKCVVNKDIISCQIKVADFIKNNGLKVIIDYK